VGRGLQFIKYGAVLYQKAFQKWTATFNSLQTFLGAVKASKYVLPLY